MVGATSIPIQLPDRATLEQAKYIIAMNCDIPMNQMKLVRSAKKLVNIDSVSNGSTIMAELALHPDVAPPSDDMVGPRTVYIKLLHGSQAWALSIVGNETAPVLVEQLYKLGFDEFPSTHLQLSWAAKDISSGDLKTMDELKVFANGTIYAIYHKPRDALDGGARKVRDYEWGF